MFLALITSPKFLIVIISTVLLNKKCTARNFLLATKFNIGKICAQFRSVLVVYLPLLTAISMKRLNAMHAGLSSGEGLLQAWTVVFNTFNRIISIVSDDNDKESAR